MTNKKIAFFLVYIVISPYCTDIAIIEGVPEWQVHVGDSKSYIFTEVLSHQLNHHQVIIWEYDENEQVEIILKKGTILSYTITQVNTSSDTIYGYRTYNNNVSLREETFSEIVRKTVHDRSYWEEYCENEDLYSIRDNLLIREEEMEIFSAFLPKEVSIPYPFQRNGYPYFLKMVSIWDIETGWIVFSSYTAYRYVTFYNITLKLLEEEKYSTFDLPQNFIFGSLLLVCIPLIYFISKSYHQKLMKEK